MTHAPLPRRARLLASSALLLVAALAGCASVPAPSPVQAPVAVTAEPAVPQVPEALPATAGAPVLGPAAPAADDGARPDVRDALRPEVQLDLDDARAHADLWARVRRGLVLPDLDSDRVRDWERWYASRPDYVQRMTERGGRYLFHIVEEVEKRGMPLELALLPFIESAFNPQAMSSARASGMWQFIPSTGRHFDLAQNLFRDDRRDVLASTRAALDYLGKLHGMFNDWQLALAAYNWGEGSVMRALARNRRLGLPETYEALRMPAETANYVPKLQAVKNIVQRPEAFNLALEPLANHPYFVAVPIERDIDVDLAARLAGLPLDEFRALNPQMNKPVILAAGTPQLLLPYDNANRFVKQVRAHQGPLAQWTAWVAPKTLRPAEAAQLVHMDEDDLREVNRIPPRMLIKAGSTLLVPRAGHRSADVPEHVADSAMLVLAAERRPGVRRTLKAGRNDSVASIAKRYGVSTAQVAEWNDVAVGARFKAGQRVVVVVPQRSAKAAPTRTARAAVKTRKPAARASVRQAAAAGETARR
jgi:membrane-bound lytic murein transglycosylase D